MRARRLTPGSPVLAAPGLALLGILLGVGLFAGCSPSAAEIATRSAQLDRLAGTVLPELAGLRRESNGALVEQLIENAKRQALLADPKGWLE